MKFEVLYEEFNDSLIIISEDGIYYDYIGELSLNNPSNPNCDAVSSTRMNGVKDTTTLDIIIHDHITEYIKREMKKV